MLLSIQQNHNPDQATGALFDIEKQEALQRLLASRTFQRAHRVRQLLAYAAKHALAGSVNNEEQIAREFLAKDAEYHPTTDPTVRVLFGRLRRLLDRYYATEGIADGVVISIPKGSFTPEFHIENPDQPGMGPAPERAESALLETHTGGGGSGNPAVAVLPFTNLTNDPKHDSFCHGLTEEIATTLANDPAVDVIASSSGFQFKDEPVDVREAGRDLGVPLVLGGSVRKEGGHTRVTAQLARVEDGVAIWSDTIDTTAKGVLNTQRVVAKKVIDGLPITETVQD